MSDIIIQKTLPFVGNGGKLLRCRSIEIVPIHYGLLYHRTIIADARSLANNGWHIPSRAEFETLATTVGGLSVAGGKLKEAGTVYWLSPNTGATNEYGFNLRSNGFRNGNTGAFESIGSWTYMMTTTYNGAPNIICALVTFSSASLIIGQNGNYTGFGARLVKDDSNDPGYYHGNDGKYYRTVKIGNQVWVADNLAETKFRTGEVIPEVTDNAAWIALNSSAFCAYNNDWNNV
jgi:uncharacterized protein (TIGR02145 family)